jgi:hypothetical protein
VDVLIDVAFIASLKVAVTFAVALTPVAPLAGEVAVTVGGVVSVDALVVNDHAKFAASALPARSFTRGSVDPPTTVAVYVDDAANAEFGCNVAVRVAASYVTVAGTVCCDASRRKNVDPEIVVGSIASLNVAVTGAPTATPVAPVPGDVPTTLGGVVSVDTDVNTTSTQ